MEYLQYEFEADQGDAIEVTLDAAANVQLLDPANFAAYKDGRQYRYHGGYFRQSPVELVIPNTGRWHVVVDLGGMAGRVRASVRLIKAAAGATA